LQAKKCHEILQYYTVAPIQKVSAELDSAPVDVLLTLLHFLYNFLNQFFSL